MEKTPLQDVNIESTDQTLPQSPEVNTSALPTPVKPSDPSIIQSTPMSAKSGVSKMMMILVVVVVILAAIAFYFWQKSSSPSSPSPVVVLTPNVSPVESPSNTTSDMQTYTNTDLKFSFNYPSELKYVEADFTQFINHQPPYREGVGTLILVNYPLGEQNPEAQTKGVEVSLTVSPDDGKTLAQDAQNASYPHSDPTQTLTVGGEPALKGNNRFYELARANPTGDQTPIPTVWFKHNGLLYDLGFTDDKNNDHPQWFDQVLSSFKFSN